MKRLILYVHYDADGKLDPHILFQLSRLVEEKFFIVFISNSPLKTEDQELLSPLVERLVLRPNRGFDFGAWKEVILRMGKKELESWDELILMNSTCYGPLFPLEPVFHHMKRICCDFWSLTYHGHYEGFPEHLQSYFIVLRRSAFLSEVFLDFWKLLPDTTTVMETIYLCEIEFSQFLIKAGLSFSVYAKSDDEHWDYEINYRPNQSFFAAYYMLRHYNIPFVKVKSFYSYPSPSIDAPASLLKYIEAETTYPVDLIVAHQHRIAPVAAQRRMPNNVLVLDTKIDSLSLNRIKIAVVMHIFYEESCAWLFEALENIQHSIDCYISVCSESIKKVVEKYLQQQRFSYIDKYKICLVENRGRDIFPWLSFFADNLSSYDVVLKIHSKKSPTVCEMFVEAWRDWISDSLLHSPAAVNQILAAFESYPKLGVILPPYPPVFHVHKQLLYSGTEELKCIQQDLYCRLGINPPPEIRAPLFPVGSMFWYRPAALQALHTLKLTRKDFPEEPLGNRETMAHAVERSILYVAQAAGYFYQLAIPKQNLVDTYLLYEDMLIKRSEEGLSLSQEELINENRWLRQNLSMLLNSRAWKFAELLRKTKHTLLMKLRNAKIFPWCGK